VKALSRQEAMEWCQKNSIPLNSRFLPERSNLDFTFRIPQDSQKRVAMAQRAMRPFADQKALLVWFDDWSVWQSGQRMHIFDRFRASYGETRKLIDRPAQLFEQGDIEDAISFVTIAVLFLWDCYVLCSDQNRFLFFSHDEFAGTRGFKLD